MRFRSFSFTILSLASTLLLTRCDMGSKADIAAEAPPPADVEPTQDSSIFRVDHPEQFPLVIAERHDAAPELKATGVISPDVSRNIPVISLASGRVVDIRARIGDMVTKGQLLLKIQSADISQAFSDYRQAVVDEKLASAELDRSKDLYEKGALAKKDLEVAEGNEAKTAVAVENAADRLRVLGADADHPAGFVEIYAPASGVITEQNVTAAAGVKTLDNSPSLFTIADLSEIWVVCDVYENDLPTIGVGQYADIHVNAYPQIVLKARIVNIAPILDPTTRTAKVRLELHNPGMLRPGMFVTATFYGQTKEAHAMVPAAAVLHLHDRDWVYVRAGGGAFQRIEVVGGPLLSNNWQEIVSGVRIGEKVVANALILQNTVEQ